MDPRYGAQDYIAFWRLFWRLVETVKQRPGPIDVTPLPLSMAIVGFHRPLPHGDHVFCQVAAPEAEPAFISRK